MRQLIITITSETEDEAGLLFITAGSREVSREWLSYGAWGKGNRKFGVVDTTVDSAFFEKYL